MNGQVDSIRQRLETLYEKIARAAQRSGRRPEDIRVVLVTKGHSVETVSAAIEAGADQLGENYAEQALPKIQALSDRNVTWHMIGHVQSRKARIVAEHFAWVHSLDSVKLARRLDQFHPDPRPLPVLLQVNVSGEQAKFGVPGWDPSHFKGLADLVQQIHKFPHLELKGLMTVPPFLSPEEVRPFFRRLRQLRERLEREAHDLSLAELSMGMSADFEVAVEEGATMVRVGTAVLGPRG